MRCYITKLPFSLAPSIAVGKSEDDVTTPNLVIRRARKRFVNLAKQDPGRARQKDKQEQEEISPNHVIAFSGASVTLRKNI